MWVKCAKSPSAYGVWFVGEEEKWVGIAGGSITKNCDNGYFQFDIEITGDGKTQAQIRREILTKESAVKHLIDKYSTGQKKAGGFMGLGIRAVT